jgi:hypothetical protein
MRGGGLNKVAYHFDGGIQSMLLRAMEWVSGVVREWWDGGLSMGEISRK